MAEPPADTMRRAAQAMRDALAREEDPDCAPTWLYLFADSWDALASEMDGHTRFEARANTYVQCDGTTTVGVVTASNIPAWTDAYKAALAYLGEAGDPS